MKTKKFYYSELQTDSGGDKVGKIKLHFEEYKFLNGNIHYDFFGYTSKTYDEIKAIVNSNWYWGKNYHLLLKNCQHYVSDLLGSLGLEGQVILGDAPENAKKPEEIMAIDPNIRMSTVIFEHMISNE